MKVNVKEIFSLSRWLSLVRYWKFLVCALRYRSMSYPAFWLALCIANLTWKSSGKNGTAGMEQ